MSAPEAFDQVGQARDRWHRTDDQLNRLRSVHAALSDLHQARRREEPGDTARQDVRDAIARLGRDSDERREALAFLTEPYFEGDVTLSQVFLQGQTVSDAVADVLDALMAYVEGGEWAAVSTAIDTVLAPPGDGRANPRSIAHLESLFALAVEAGIAHRETQSNRISDALATAYEALEDPLPALEDQPIALLPVRLETRFVDASGQTDGDLEELLVRVYPDQVHVDGHEVELTEDEVTWGRNFWATLWFARHPNPDLVPRKPNTTYLDKRLPTERLREVVAEMDRDGFSEIHAKRYDELKERAWKQLLDRFGRERAAYVVHALQPEDEQLAYDLLSRPPEPPELVEMEGPVLEVSETLAEADEGTAPDEADDGTQNFDALRDALAGTDLTGGNPVPDAGSTDIESAIEEADTTETEGGHDEVDGGSVPEGGTESEADAGGDSTGSTEEGDGVESDRFQMPADLPETLPALTFPTVPRKPNSWTKATRAHLLPDRWIAVAEWEDAKGTMQRTAVAGTPIREPLQMGPGTESVGEDQVAVEADADSPSPPGTEWMVDFEAAEEVGMGLRVRLAALAGFDPDRGFERLSVVGVKGSMDATQTPDAVADLLDAHHYTVGTEFVSQGTPSSNHEEAAAMLRADDPLDSMAVECVPPLVDRGDRSDGDLLSRALAIDRGDDRHVFANVERADATEQRNARHVNSALWPATLGYAFQNIYVDNHHVSHGSGRNPSLWDRGDSEVEVVGDGVDEHLLWHDAYRRHFIRYVRGRGPFPALRIGSEPYGILPAGPIETHRNLAVLETDVLGDLQDGTLSVHQLTAEGTELESLAQGGISPETLVKAGARPDEVLEAGADETHLVAGSTGREVTPEIEDLIPASLTQDGVGLLETSRLTRKRIEEADFPADRLSEAGITPAELVRGEISNEKLRSAGLTTETVADLVLPSEVRALGITPRTVAKAGVEPAALLRGEFTEQQVSALGLDTRAVADAILPPEFVDAGVTPKRLEEAGIEPVALLSGNVDAETLAEAGLSPELAVELLMPEELAEAGVTPEQVVEAGVAGQDLFAGDLEYEQLRQAGLTTESIANLLLPEAFQEVGITSDSLQEAGITPEAVLNGEVTPAHLLEAGVTPDALAEAGMLPDALAEVDESFGALLDAGLDPGALLEGDLTLDTLTDAGLDPRLLVEAGLAPARLVDAGIDIVGMASDGTLSLAELAEAGADPAKLARAGSTVADIAAGDIPADEAIKAGFNALDLLGAGFDAVGLTEGGARPTELREMGVDAGTLRSAGQGAGALRAAGYDAEELLESGYDPQELLSAGFTPAALEAAGVDSETARAGARSVDELLTAGHPPAELHEEGFSAQQLLEGGIDPAGLVEAGYSAGELLDAGLDTPALAEAGVDIGELRAAGADVASLRAAGVDLSSLCAVGVTATHLLEEEGVDPPQLLEAGYSKEELEAGGVDVEALLDEDEDDGPEVEELPQGIEYAVAVLEDPEQAENDRYRFSFDPATPADGLTVGQVGRGRNRATEAPTRETHETASDVGGGTGAPHRNESETGGVEKDTESTGSGRDADSEIDSDSESDGGVDTGVPVVRTVAIDDHLPSRLERRIAGFGDQWSEAATALPFGNQIDEDGLLNALKRSAIGQDVRQMTKLYTGEQSAGMRYRNIAVQSRLLPPHQNELRSTLEAAEATDLDPRLTHLYPTDAGHGDVGDYLTGGLSGTLLGNFYRRHLQEGSRQTIPPEYTVDHHLDGFIELLLDSSIREIDDLSASLDVESLSLDLDTLGVDESWWSSRGHAAKRGSLLWTLETNDDPEGYVDQLLVDESGDVATLRRLARNVADYGDAGTLRTLLRVLLQHGILQEYVSARRRLGEAYDDPPAGWPEPGYWTNTEGSLQSLQDSAPRALDSHPDVHMPTLEETAAEAGSAIHGELDFYTYADALRAAAANYSSTTSIDSRLSEFTDSLGYLRDLEPGLLYDLVQESLDVASHRIDAWWTSLATKRLFELREVQGTVTGDNVDHDQWDAGGGDAPRATLDPGLLDHMADNALDPTVSEDSGQVDTEAEESGAFSEMDIPGGDGATETSEESVDSQTEDQTDATALDVAVEGYAEYNPANVDVLGQQSDDDDDIQVDGGVGAWRRTQTLNDDPSVGEGRTEAGSLTESTSGGIADQVDEPTETTALRSGETTTNEEHSTGENESETADSPGEDDETRDTRPSVDSSSGDSAIATRADADPEAMSQRAESDPGLYVGAYGYVEQLSADVQGNDDPEYVHAPSPQHATTAAVLRSAAAAHDADEGGNPLSVNLAPDRVRTALWLIRGIRRGQSMGELLGYRFERRIHEETMADSDVNLMQYAGVFRAAFPATRDKLQRPDDDEGPGTGTSPDGSEDTRSEELAARDALDGLALLNNWDEYPFEEGDTLPPPTSREYNLFDEVIAELEHIVGAADDLMTAESIHQLGQGNFERAGGSIDAVAKGEQLSIPEVIRTPRSVTGVSHRQCVLLGDDLQAPTQRPRSQAEPTLAAWVDRLLPDLSTVECVATYRWSTEEGTEREVSVTKTLASLELGPLDVLFLFGSDREEARSEVEERLVYRLLRTRPAEPAVPETAAVSLALTESDSETATSVADLLELTRSLRTLVENSRPATAADLSHPTEVVGEGYDSNGAATLVERANDAQDALWDLASSIDERVSVLAPAHTQGDALAALDTPEGNQAESDGGQPDDSSWEQLTSGVMLPGQPVAPLSEPGLDELPITDQAAEVVAAADNVANSVPLRTIESVANAIDGPALLDELRTLAPDLESGLTDPDATSAAITVTSERGQRVSGTLGQPVAVPDVPNPADETTGGERETDTDVTAGESTEDSALAWGETVGPAEGFDGEMAITWPQSGGDSGGGALAAGDFQVQPIDSDDEGEGSEGISEVSYDFVLVSPETVATVEEEEVDWSTDPATIKIWGTDGLSWFERTATTTPDADGTFAIDIDFNGIEPGTPFTVTAQVDGDIVYVARGRVVAETTGTAPANTLQENCPNLRRLLWLQDRFTTLSSRTGPSAGLALALDAADWPGMQAEADAVTPADYDVTAAQIASIEALTDLKDVDPSALANEAAQLVGPIARLGLHAVFDVTGDGGPADCDYWYGETAALSDVRARLLRTTRNPAHYVDDAAPWLLKYDHDSAAVLSGLDDGDLASAYFEAFLGVTEWVVPYLDDALADPAGLVRDLTEWLHTPGSVDRAALSRSLTSLADVVSEHHALRAAFGGLPVGRADNRLAAFESHLRALADAIDEPVPGYASATNAESTFDTVHADAATRVEAGARDERTALEDLLDAPPADVALRTAVLERLREPMATAAAYGVLGGVPSEPVGGQPSHEDRLLEQARALLERLRERLQASAALDPRIESSPANRPTPQRVEDQVDRLEALFGDGFTVLPPFEPSNREELVATFTDADLLPDDRRMAAETWLQRAGRFRDRVNTFSEARSYAEVLTGSLTPSLTVGQVPYEPGDTWVGADGVKPEPGRLSLVAQFGPGVSPATAGDRMTGLFIDEWTEAVPDDTETTGVALNYDDPGNRAPNSILLVPPPDSGSEWSIDRLAATVAETSEYAKRRAVDHGDTEGLHRLFPGLYFVEQAPEGVTPIADFSNFEQTGYRGPPQLLARLVVGDFS